MVSALLMPGWLCLTLVAIPPQGNAGPGSWRAVTDGPRPAPVATTSHGAATSDDIRAAFRSQGYPWYDARADRVVPVLPQPDFEAGIWKRIRDTVSAWLAPIGRFFRRLNAWRVPGVGGAGDLLAVGLVLLLLTVVVVALMELLRRYRPSKEAGADAKVVEAGGRSARIEGVLSQMRLDLADPWAEAQRLRARGDYAGAIVHLFAHQILTLVRAGLLRIVPGRTGRQLVRSLADRGLRSTVEPVLRLFEAVYYGHHVPSVADFEAAWSQAEPFERHVARRNGEAAS